MSEHLARWLRVAGATLVGVSACQRQPAPVTRPNAAPMLPPAVAAPTQARAAQSQPAAAPDTATEHHVTIDTHGRELDVRQVLDFLANEGHFTLVYSPAIDKKVRLQLNNVPISVALQTVLSMANLTLESTTEPPKAPGSTSIVFYELPVNVDSLGVEAIMKRFGVGRGIAEMIVSSRVEKP